MANQQTTPVPPLEFIPNPAQQTAMQETQNSFSLAYNIGFRDGFARGHFTAMATASAATPDMTWVPRNRGRGWGGRGRGRGRGGRGGRGGSVVTTPSVSETIPETIPEEVVSGAGSVEASQ